MYNYNYYPDYNMMRNDGQQFAANNQIYPEAQDERFFFAPFLVGGLAGTALGYGIANNNQLNNNNGGGCCGGPVFFYPQQPMMAQPAPYMYSSNSNNFYY